MIEASPASQREEGVTQEDLDAAIAKMDEADAEGWDEEKSAALIAEARGVIRAARVATRDQRTPPWKTPAGRARKALVRRRKAQRQARRAQR